MAQGDWGGGSEWGINPAVLPTAEVERESILLVAVPLRAGKKRQQARALASQSRSKAAKKPKQATFALVSEDGGDLGSSGIELVLRDGRRLRIGRGVDEETLRTVVGVLEEGC